MLYLRDRADAVEQPCPYRLLLRWRQGHSGPPEPGDRDIDVVLAKSDIKRQQVAEAADEQQRADDQHERDGHLRHDQELLE